MSRADIRASTRVDFLDNIRYLMIVFVVIVQTALLQWTGGLVPVKFAVVFLLALALSFAINRWVIMRYHRGFEVGLLLLFVFCLAFRP